MIDEVIPVEVVRSFRNLAIRHLGIDIDIALEPMVGSRIAKRLKHLQLPLHRYLTRLYQEKDGDEIVAFLDFIRPRPAPLFARKSDHLRLHRMIREWLAIGCRRFRFWSAGCGSGEEPYALALTARSAIEYAEVDPSTVDYKVLATDISERMIEHGKRGLFERSQVRNVPQGLHRRFFAPTEAGILVADEIKSHIVFRRLNLAATPFPITRRMDAIFCHEGLAPMVPTARTRAARAAQSLLAGDGLFCTGFGDEITRDPDEQRKGQAAHSAPGATRTPGHC